MDNNIDKYSSYNSEDSVYHPSVTSDDGEIKNYDMSTKILYPHIVLEADDLPYYRIRVLSNVIEKLEFIHDKVPENYYDVYLHMGENIMCLGMIHSDNMRALLQGELYSSLNKYIMLSENEKVEGIMMFALCTSPMY